MSKDVKMSYNQDYLFPDYNCAFANENYDDDLNLNCENPLADLLLQIYYLIILNELVAELVNQQKQNVSSDSELSPNSDSVDAVTSLATDSSKTTKPEILKFADSSHDNHETITTTINTMTSDLSSSVDTSKNESASTDLKLTDSRKLEELTKLISKHNSDSTESKNTSLSDSTDMIINAPKLERKNSNARTRSVKSTHLSQLPVAGLSLFANSSSKVPTALHNSPVNGPSENNEAPGLTLLSSVR